MGVREILWLAIALLAVYVAVQLYRVLKMGTAEPAKPRQTSSPPPLTTGTGRSGRPARGAAAEPAGAGETGAAAASALAAGVDQTSGDGFQLELETQQLRRDVAQLRAELGEQRKEIADLAARLRVHQEQVEAGAGVKRVSPEYDEALVFARRGLDVETIAERCGITVAEAALVRALAQRDAGDAGEQR